MVGKVIDSLTSFEHRVLWFIMEGYSRQEVADALGAAPYQVEEAFKTVIRKLKWHNAELSNGFDGFKGSGFD